MKSTLHIHPVIIRLISLIILAVAVSVLIGWSFDIEILKRISPNFVAMNPTSAVCFILFSAIIFLGTLESATAKRLRIMLATVIATVGILKIIELLSGIIIGVDTILFQDKLVTTIGKLPNKIAPNTALNLALLSISIIVLETKLRYRVWVAQMLIFISLVLSSLAIIGYIFNLVQLYSVASYIPMALHTAITFILISCSLFLLRPSEGLLSLFAEDGYFVQRFNNLPIRSKLFLSFGSLIALLVVFGVYSYRTIIDIQNEQLPARTNIRNISAALLGMQNYERNFLLYDVRNQDNSPFFEDGISLNIDRWQHEYESYITNLKELQEHSRINSPSGILPAIDRLNKLVFDYQIDFLTLTDRYKVRGFGQHGLEGDARAAAQSLESRVANDSGSLSLLLQARRYEKDFFLRSDSRALQNHAAAVNNLRSRLARDVEGLRLLQDYEEAFQRVVSIDGEIGLTPDTGIRGEIATSILKIHPIISKTQAEVLDRTNQSIRVFARLLAVLTALFVLLGIGFSLLITRLIQRSLAGLQEAAHDLAEGKMEKRIQTTGKDELGLLAGTFNDMANKLALSRATLEREKAKDEAILGGIGDAVFAIDTDGKIILFNPVASEITGFTDAEAIGQPYEKVLQFQYEGKNKKNDVFIREALSGKRTQMSNHTVVVRKDGEKVAVADSAAPLLDENGKVAGVVVVFRDVTQERAIDQAKSEFVSLASHQLRTPLSAINWYAEMLLAGDAGKINTEQKKYLKEIYDGNQRMVELVNALLNVSRLELGTFAIEPEPIDVKEIAESMLKEIAPMAKAKQMTVVAEYQPKLPKFSADPKLIRMIIQNLMTNAVKYTPDKGKVTLSISHEVHKKSKKAEFLITVSDNGYGIPKKQQEKIFTKLFRAENVQQKDTEGTGLGLYILKSIVDNSGGKIWFDSVEDKGTTFSVSYPTTGMIKREGSKSLD